MTEPRVLDCRGMACPQPVLSTKKALEEGSAPLRVVVDNEASATNVQRFAESKGARVTLRRADGDIHLLVEPGVTAAAASEPAVTCELPEGDDLVAFVTAEIMGRGDDELGAILMAAFLDTLSHFRGRFAHAIFVNGGARLAVQGSPVLDQIRQLEEMGVEVLVCGTCLDFFGIRDRLAVGRVSNMYDIIDTLSRAGRIIRP